MPPAPRVDLSHVEALSDLPDDARVAFANAADVRQLGRDDEVSGFALALVLEGSVDVAATIVDVAAARLEQGAVLRARGTIDSVTPLRLIGASDSARVATWDEAAVAEAFGTCPWVEDDLRAAGDRMQAEIGVTISGKPVEIYALLGGQWPHSGYMVPGGVMCAPTLTDRFGPCGGGDQHGHTSQLTAAQISDLVAYLSTL